MTKTELMYEHIILAGQIKNILRRKYPYLDIDDIQSYANIGYTQACFSFNQTKGYEASRWIKKIGIARAIDCIRKEFKRSNKKSNGDVLVFLTNSIVIENDEISGCECNPSIIAETNDMVDFLFSNAQLEADEKETLKLKFISELNGVEIGKRLAQMGFRKRPDSHGRKDAPLSDSKVSKISISGMKKIKKLAETIV